MFEVYYCVSSMYPRYYSLSLVYYNGAERILTDRATFTAWIEVEEYAKKYDAILVFDGLI